MNPDRKLPVLRIDLRPSIELAALLGCVHLAAAVLLVCVVPSAAWVIPLCCVIAIDALWTIRKHALLRHVDAVIGFDLADEDGCELRLRNGKRVSARILPTTYVTLWLIVLNLEIPQRCVRRHVVIWRDGLPEDIRRRLRIRLRWARLEVPQRASSEAPL